MCWYVTNQCLDLVNVAISAASLAEEWAVGEGSVTSSITSSSTGGAGAAGAASSPSVVSSTTTAGISEIKINRSPSIAYQELWG